VERLTAANAKTPRLLDYIIKDDMGRLETGRGECSSGYVGYGEGKADFCVLFDVVRFGCFGRVSIL